MSDSSQRPYYVDVAATVDDPEGELPEEVEPSTELGTDADVDVQSTVAQAVEEGFSWREQFLDPFQAKALDYYKGEPFGNEETGRSQIVSTDVRDTIRKTLPSLMRVFFGPENVVEFMPRGPEDQEIADQQTEAMNFTVREDNNGFIEFYSWFKDALLLRLGGVKWFWETRTDTTIEEFEGLTLEEFSAILADFDNEPGIESFVDNAAIVRQNDLGEDIYDLSVEVVHTDGRARFVSVPSEEIIWSPSARNKADALMIGHVREVPADELIAMGVPEDIVSEHRGETRDVSQAPVDLARRLDKGGGFPGSGGSGDEGDEATRPTVFGEIYMRIAVGDDEIATLRKFLTIGNKFRILNGNGELVDEIPMAFLTPDPMPHDFLGLSQTDSTDDIQEIKSFVTRGILDSLANAIDPVTEVVNKEVNMQDVMSRTLSRIIRAKKPGMIREVPHRWVGGDALPMLQYLDQVRDERIGIPKSTQGLDADALQSSTAEAVRMTREGGVQQLEMVARIFAETGVRELFKGLLRLTIRHQATTRRRVIRLRNKWTPIDPARWDASMDVRVNVALGSGLAEEKMAALQGTLAAQLKLMEVGAPIVSWSLIRATLAKLAELGGQPNPDLFWAPFGPDDDQKFAQQQAESAQQEKDPAVLLAEVEQMKIQTDNETKRLQIESTQAAARLMDDRERDKEARDFAIAEEKLRLDYAKLGIADKKVDLDAAVARDRALLDAEVKKDIEGARGLAALANRPVPSPGVAEGDA